VDREQIDAAAAMAGAHALVPFSASQPQYSMLWRKPEAPCFLHARAMESATWPSRPGPWRANGQIRAGRTTSAGNRAASEEMNQFMETAGRHYRSDSLLSAVAR